ncbi:MAG: toll/interleukin-1 receptor domain-containing protein [Planctomycetaceae bacterium]|nr:toll/interleukin-1 receptor domain-containing protein [Planctomycetaceae bacterium]
MAKKKTKSPRGNKSAKRTRRGPNYQVFVSHATADKWIATTFCEKIDATGATSFRDDRDINGGDSIPETIRTEIQVSRELVVLLSPESIERPWVLLEVGAAWGRRKNYRIVPVLCHVSFDAIPDIIEGKKAFHINDFDNYLAELKRRVRN